MAKYHNTKSHGYDSQKERRRHEELAWLEKAKKISGLQHQVKYELIPSQKIDGKVAERACHYIADFVYIEDGKAVVEDCKGFRTKDYIIKRKLMLFVHGIRVRET